MADEERGTEKPATKRKRTFTEEDVRVLTQYIFAKPSGRILASDLQDFYEQYPQTDSIFSSRLVKVTKLYPNLLRLVKDDGNEWLVACELNAHEGADQRLENKNRITSSNSLIDTKSSVASETELVRDAVDAFATFLRARPAQSSTASELHLFYNQYPEYKKVFSGGGKFKELAKRFPQQFTMESAVGGGQTTFRAISCDHTVDGSQVLTKDDDITYEIPGVDGDLLVTPSISKAKEWLQTHGSSGKSLAFNLEIAGPDGYCATFATEKHVLILICNTATDWERFPVDSGFYEVLATPTLTKVCYRGKRNAILARRGDPDVSSSLAQLWDVSVAANILGSSTGNAQLSLSDILEEYEISVPFEAVKDLSAQHTLKTKEGAWYVARSCMYLPLLYQRMWDDAFSRDLLVKCLRYSEIEWKNGWSSSETHVQETQAAKLLRDPTTRKAAAMAKKIPQSAAAAQSFQARVAAAKRNEGLKQRNLASNACYHFHVTTPGECSRGVACKFSHHVM